MCVLKVIKTQPTFADGGFQRTLSLVNFKIVFFLNKIELSGI